jgi:PII-like signaling protein
MESTEYSVLKIYASSTDQLGTRLLYEHIVLLAKEKEISGVTVYRGIMGFGKSSSHISSSKYWELTEKLPLMIEMVDETKKLLEFYPFIEPELLKTKKGCLVTLEPVTVLLQKPGSKAGREL